MPSSMYTLVIGRLTASSLGQEFLEKQQTLSMLMKLLTARMDVYLKLIISSVDNRRDFYSNKYFSFIMSNA